MVAVPTVILVQIVTLSLPGMRLSGFSVGEPVWGRTATFLFLALPCNAHRQDARVAIEQVRGVYPQDRVTSAARWFVVAGLHAGIGIGEGTSADEGLGRRAGQSSQTLVTA